MYNKLHRKHWNEIIFNKWSNYDSVQCVELWALRVWNKNNIKIQTNKNLQEAKRQL